MTEQRKKLIERFQRWLDTNPHKSIIAAQCANIAEQYHKEQLMLGGVVGRSEQCSGCDWLTIDYKLRKCIKCQKYENME
jgi:hypothetical protein